MTIHPITKPLILPQINLNGTARAALVEQQVAVLRAFEDLREAMAEAAPNGRDYQHRPTEYGPAREAWMERLQMIVAMRQEIEQHALAIQEA